MTLYMGADTNTLLSFDGVEWRDRTSVGPSARSIASGAFDSKRKEFVLFGGLTGFPITFTPVAAETWVHDGTSWSPKSSLIAPDPRWGAAMAYDSRRDRTVLFGGSVSFASAFDDTWEWDGASWAPITTPVKPSPRVGHTMTYDAARGVILLQGGVEITGTGIKFISDVWSFDGTSWTQLAATTAMPARFFAGAAYDAALRKVVAFGGRNGGAAVVPDSWSWEGTQWAQVLTTARPLGRSGQAQCSALDGAGLVIFGGATGYEIADARYADTWSLRYDSRTPRELCEGGIDNDGDQLVACADPDCWYRCAPLCPPGVSCDPAAPRCGDGACSPVEDGRLCPMDCPVTTVCGDNFCDSTETQGMCRADCTP